MVPSADNTGACEDKRFRPPSFRQFGGSARMGPVQRLEDTFLWKLLEISFWELAALIAAIIFGFWLIFRVGLWLRDDKDATADDRQMLMQIRDLHREGDLDEEEYRSIKGRITERLDDAPQQAEQSE